MKERSSELRSVLVESVDPRQVESTLEEDVSNDFIDTNRVQELVYQFDAEQEYLQSLEARHQELSDVYPYLSEQEFEETYKTLKQEINQTLKRIRRRSDQKGEYRPFTVDFVDISTIDSLDAFLEQFPMQFIPRK